MSCPLHVRTISSLLIALAIASLSLACTQAGASKGQDEPQQTKVAQRSRVPGLSDSEYIPLYPGAEIIEVEDKSVLERRLEYRAPTDFLTLEAFYKEALPPLGWSLQVEYKQFGGRYTWTNPTSSLPWHMELDVYHLVASGTETVVNLKYSRFPDIENIPVYPDGHSVAIEHAEKEQDPDWGGFPIRITTKTYLTSASPKEVEDYYNSTLAQYGWVFYDIDKMEYTDAQTGSITSNDGMFFMAHRFGSEIASAVRIDLTITAAAQPDGQTQIRLYAEEIERLTVPRDQ